MTKQIKAKDLTLVEVYDLLCEYNYKYENSKERISKKDFKEYTFLLWLKDKLLKQECKELLQASKQIGYCPSIPHHHTRCNNDKYEMYKRERNEATYYYDFFGLDVDYAKRQYTKKNRTKKQKENKTKVVNEPSPKELPEVKTLSRLLKDNQTYNKLKLIR